jgi:hypothetical protein
MRKMNVLNFLKEDNGNESMMRLLVAFVVVIIIGVWAYISLRKLEIAPMKWEEVSAIVGALTAKAWQKQSEAKGELDEKNNLT